jgi:hypothetical protein
VGAVTRNLTIEQGTTWQQAWRIQLDGVDLDEAAGWQARSQVRAKKVDPAVLHEFTARVVGSVVQLSATADESSAWAWRRGVYDVELADQSTPPRVVRVVQGTISISPEVTREAQ